MQIIPLTTPFKGGLYEIVMKVVWKSTWDQTQESIVSSADLSPGDI